MLQITIGIEDWSIQGWKPRKSDYCLSMPYFSQKRAKKQKVFDPFIEYHTRILNYLTDVELKSEKVLFGNAASNPGLSEFPFLEYGHLLSLVRTINQNTNPEIQSTQLLEDCKVEVMDLFQRVYHVLSPILIQVEQSQFALPQKSTFAISDLKDLPKILKVVNERYDFILMDPPWANASVARSDQYPALDCYDLFKIPLHSVLDKAGYVGVWVSNNAKFHKFVLNRLFPDWKLHISHIIIWLKFTTEGELVMPIDSTHRKPYEICYIGHTKHCGEPEIVILKSIPSKIHSRKPPLDKILDEFLSQDAKKMELFGRCVREGWTCWGNETILLNDTMVLEKSSIL
jgi:N6-adenosine-specific RNA methylase IME4